MVSARSVRRIALLAAALLLVSALPATASGPEARTFTVIASGLNNPRGVDVLLDGTVYVAEAGIGGTSRKCFPSPEDPDAKVCLGLTGSITRIYKGAQERIVTRLPSLAGPGGFAASGPEDVSHQGDDLYAAIGLGADPVLADAVLKRVGGLMGTIVTFTDPPGGGRPAAVMDPAGFEGVANPDGGHVDSNPTGVLPVGRKLYVTDAGGNSLLVMTPSGVTRTVAVFPTTLVPPPFPGPPVIPMEAVPTNLDIGPDKALYVSQLTGFPFPPGGSSIYRVDRFGAMSVYATGFTNVIDLEFGFDGTLYVLEISNSGLLSGLFDGALWEVPPGGGTPTMILGGGALFAPGGLAVAPDGTVFVSNCGICPGTGEVLAVDY